MPKKFNTTTTDGFSIEYSPDGKAVLQDRLPDVDKQNMFKAISYGNIHALQQLLTLYVTLDLDEDERSGLLDKYAKNSNNITEQDKLFTYYLNREKLCGDGMGSDEPKEGSLDDAYQDCFDDINVSDYFVDVIKAQEWTYRMRIGLIFSESDCSIVKSLKDYKDEIFKELNISNPESPKWEIEETFLGKTDAVRALSILASHDDIMIRYLRIMSGKLPVLVYMVNSDEASCSFDLEYELVNRGKIVLTDRQYNRIKPVLSKVVNDFSISRESYE